MSDNYVRKEVRPNIIHYIFDNEISNEEILSFFDDIEHDEKVIKCIYDIKTATDEYETGIYECSKNSEINREILDGLDAVGITMTVYIENNKPNFISHGINSNGISLNCKESPEVSNIVESHITRQLSR